VLVIEDEPGILDFLLRGLKGRGFEVASATDGTEGERLALSESFDAIVLDLMLPGMAAWKAPSLSCSRTCSDTTGGCSRASRSSGRCGQLARPRPPTIPSRASSG